MSQTTAVNSWSPSAAFLRSVLRGMVALLDITDRTHARVLSSVDLGPGSAPHDLLLTHDNKRVVVTDYFLDEDDFGKVHFDGDP